MAQRPRWLIPAPKIFEQIIADRELQKGIQHQKLIMITPSSTTLEEKVPAFVNILDDNYFKGQLHLITKETWNAESNVPLPKKLAGLRLPKLKPGVLVQTFIVYRISKTAASKYGLRLKAKRRRKRKKCCEEAMDTTELPYAEPIAMEVEEASLPPSSPQTRPTLTPIPFEKLGLANHNQNKKVEITSGSTSGYWMPFSPNILLNSTRIIYNNGSRGRFSQSSYFYNTLDPNLKSDKTRISGKKLLQSILNLPVHTFPRTANNTNSNLFESLSDLTLRGKLTELEIILDNIIKFHLKVHDISGLVKSCTTPWIESKVSTKANIEKTPLDASFGNNSQVRDVINAEKKFMTRRLLESVPISAVLGGVSTILRISGTNKLLGSNSNRRGFLKFLKQFLMAGVKCELQLAQLMRMLKPRDCRWLDGVEDPVMRIHIFAKTMVWVFLDYVLNFLKMGFYITEAQATRLQLTFYFQDTWRSLSSTVKYRLIKTLKLRQIHLLGTEGLIPTATFRFIPKKEGLRPIVGLGWEKKISQMDLRNIRLLLSYVAISIAPHAVISEICLRNLWTKFVQEWKGNACPKLYYLRLDIRDAFPSVIISKLHSILRELVDVRKDYVVKEAVVGTVKRRTIGVLTVVGEDNLLGNSAFLRQKIISRMTGNRKFNVKEALAKILKIIKSSEIIKIGKQFYHFSHGLPQGSSVSQVLCNIYYGHMEQIHLAEFLKEQGEFFVRSVDDYFFISPDPNRIASLYYRMRHGISEYGCFVKGRKSTTNIFVSSELATLSEEWVVFCGWRFSITSGHVARDFTSYAGIDACATMTFSMADASSPEDFITKRMLFAKPLRLCDLILDPRINCKWRIARTMFEAALMMSFRFFAGCRIMYKNLHELSEPESANTLCSAISKFAGLLFSIMKRHCPRSIQTQDFNCTCLASVPKDVRIKTSITEFEVRYIVYQAFFMKLKKYAQCPYEGLMGKLERLIKELECGLSKPAYRYLPLLVGTTMPEYFKKIKK